MYRGKCLCGKIEYSVNQEIEDIIVCHCSECRKVQGSAFAVNGSVKNDNKSRFFCKSCGAPIFAKLKNNPAYTRIRLGLIKEDISAKITKHIFVESKANWDTICDDIPQHKEW